MRVGGVDPLGTNLSYVNNMLQFLGTGARQLGFQVIVCKFRRLALLNAKGQSPSYFKEVVEYLWLCFTLS